MTENNSQETLALTLKLKLLPESQEQVTSFKQTMTTYVVVDFRMRLHKVMVQGRHYIILNQKGQSLI